MVNTKCLGISKSAGYFPVKLHSCIEPQKDVGHLSTQGIACMGCFMVLVVGYEIGELWI